jgi:hypothetical protein
VEGVLPRGFAVPHAEDQKPLPEGRAAQKASSET